MLSHLLELRQRVLLILIVFVSFFVLFFAVQIPYLLSWYLH